MGHVVGKDSREQALGFCGQHGRRSCGGGVLAAAMDDGRCQCFKLLPGAIGADLSERWTRYT